MKRGTTTNLGDLSPAGILVLAGIKPLARRGTEPRENTIQITQRELFVLAGIPNFFGDYQALPQGVTLGLLDPLQPGPGHAPAARGSS